MCIKIQGETSETSGTTKGLIHGNVLDCLFFNAALEKVVRDGQLEVTGNIVY